MSTVIHVPHPIAGCFVAAEQIIGVNRSWEPGEDPRSAEFVGKLPALAADAGTLAENMESTASFDAAEVNEFFASRGFPQITFDDFGPDRFGTGAILQVALTWLQAGTLTSVVDWTENGAKQVYPGVLTEQGGRMFVKEADGDEPAARIFELEAENGFRVYMTLANRPYGESFEVANAINDIRQNMTALEYEWQDGIFPMISLNIEDELKWVVGINTVASDGRLCTADSGQQITRFGMDHLGAELASAAAVTFALECVKRYDFEFTKPFLMWIERDGVNEPLLSAYVDKDTWKNPRI